MPKGIQSCRKSGRASASGRVTQDGVPRPSAVSTCVSRVPGGCEYQSSCEPVVSVTTSHFFMKYSAGTTGVPGTVLGTQRGIRPVPAREELTAVLTDAERDTFQGDR